MPAMGSDCDVLVTGLTSEVSTEELELFLESPRFCPEGGTVKEVKSVSTNSALVTFEDCRVAKGLLGKSVTMPDGPKITFRGSTTCQDHKTAADHRNSQWVDSDIAKMDANKKSGRKTLGKPRESEVREATTSYERQNASSRLASSGQSSPEPEVVKGERQSNAAHDLIENCSISFKRHILKLIQLILDSRQSPNRTALDYDFANETVRVRGTQESVLNASLELHEIANSAVVQSTDICCRSIQGILSSAKGEGRLQEEFIANNLLAVVHNGRVAAKDEETLKKSIAVVKRLFTTEDVKVKEDAVAYLGSTSWTENLADLQADRLISVEYLESEKMLKVSGCSKDVQESVISLRKLLGLNCAVTISIKSKRGIVRLLKNSSSESLESNSIRASLTFDEQKGLISLRGLQDDVDSAAEAIGSRLKAVCYGRYEVSDTGVIPGMFTDEQSAGRDLIDLLEVKNKCAIEVRSQFQKESKHHERSTSKSNNRTNRAFNVLKANIVEFTQADVLVNPVQKRPGAVMNAFLKAGGQKLTEEFGRKCESYDFGNDAFVTSAHGSLRAKHIIHSVIGDYRNRESVDRLCSAIKKCLEMAKHKGANSIAFPTVGCGRLGFRPEQVSDCFKKAAAQSHCELEIFIVSLEDDLVRTFQTLCDSHKSPPLSSHHGDHKHHKASGVVFHINAVSEDIIQSVKEKLAQKISNMTTEAPIYDKAVAKLSRESISSIKTLQSDQVSIEIDTDRSTVTVRGEKDAANEARHKIHGIIFRDSTKREHDRLSRLVDFNRVPDYWTKHKTLNDKDPGFSKVDRVELSSKSDLYKEISRLVMETWEPEKVGQGSDASGLGQHKIKICKIYCLENPKLYMQYVAKKRQHCIAAASNPCLPISRLKKERSVKTMTLGLRNLEATLSKNVNECFLLHGTKKDIVDSVQTQGLDTRLAGENAMFGCGAYLSESSTKADQYADSKEQRVGKGHSLYMFVCRVFLGCPFICQSPERYRRPPCKKCLTEKCKPTPHRRLETFDSVVGTHRSDGQRLLFREFIIYHPDQSYPDFLVKYERV